jgi:hypothetical protein
MHVFKAKINEAREELSECDPYITTMLAEASAIAGKKLGSKKINDSQYEECMETVKKLAGEFQNKCYCNTKMS